MKKVVVIILCFVVQLGFSQETLDELYVPKENSVFDVESSSLAQNNSEYASYKHAIKLMPFLIPKGIFAAHYEYVFSDLFSVSMGLGTQYFNNYFVDISLVGEFGILITESNNINFYDFFESSVFVPGINLFYNPAIRFQYDSYWSGEKAYIQFDFRFSSFNKLYSHEYYDASNNYQTKDFEILMRNTSINFISGAKYFTQGNICFVHEFYWGAGLNIISYNDLEPGSTNGISGGDNGNLKVSKNRVKYLGYSFLVGYNLGIGWK